MIQRGLRYSNNKEAHTEVCPNCEQETYIDGLCNKCFAGYNGIGKVENYIVQTKSKVESIILLSFGNTIYKSQIEVTKEKYNGDEHEFQIKVTNPGLMMSNNAYFYETGTFSDDTRQTYFKKKAVQPKYYSIAVQSTRSFVIRNGKTSRAKTIQGLPYLDTNELIKELLAQKY